MSNETVARLPHYWTSQKGLSFPLKYQGHTFIHYEEFHEYIASHFPGNVKESFNPNL